MQAALEVYRMAIEAQGSAAVTPRRETRRTRWVWLLVLPYLGLCFPVVYARTTPSLLGFPFFYWYQFAWVVLASGLLWIVYRRLRESE